MNEKRTHIDLFSGIGGFTLAAESCGFRTIQFVEKNEYCQKVLKKHWPEIPCHEDIKTFSWKQSESPFLITAGVPCQPSSVGGKQHGSRDVHGRWLWPDAIRIISEARPRYALMENPTGLLSVDGGRAWAGILSDFQSIGYDGWWETLGSYAVGAPHKRFRVWLLVADSERSEWGNESHCGEARRVGRELEPFPWNESPESALRRLRGMDDGSGYTSHRVDTIRNAITPQVAQMFLKLL